MSMKRFSVYVERKDKEYKKKSEIFLFDNGVSRVEIDKTTGLMKSYSVNGIKYVENGFSLCMYEDNPDPWAMGVFQQNGIGEKEEQFALSEKPSGIFEGLKSVEVIEDGDIYTGIEAFFEKDDSKARIEYRIYKNSPDIDVIVNLYFNEANKVVKLKLPVIGGKNVIGQTAFGTEELFSDGRENVSQRFTGVKAGGKVVALIDKSRYGSSYKDGNLYMTLVRGTTYCAHPVLDREIIPKDRFTQKADQGEHDYYFRLTVAGENELERKANEFNRKPYAVNVFPTGTSRPENDFTFELSNKNITLVTMKKSEEKEGYAIRLLNNSSEPASTEITLCKAKIKAEFGVYEVKTYLYANGKLREERELTI